MAALNRPTEATYVLHEEVTVDTSDNEDHTFCGVIFPVECKEGLPIDHLAITSIAVRGELGPITLWINQDDTDDPMDVDPTPSTTPSQAQQQQQQQQQTSRTSALPTRRPTRRRNSHAISVNRRKWTKIYERCHPPSFQRFVQLQLDTPLQLRPGQVRGIYIHSAKPGDESIVYDNQTGPYTHDDDFVRIHPGLAHLSNVPFGSTPPWEYGSAWREHREFVGQVSYGVVYKLWNPNEYAQFGVHFQTAARTLFACQRRFESPLSRMPDDVIFYILNMCRWDWFEDTAEQLLERSAALDEEESEDSSSDDEDDDDENDGDGDDDDDDNDDDDNSDGDDPSSDDDDDDDSDDNENQHVELRAYRRRRCWERRSHRASIFASLRRGLYSVAPVFGGTVDIEFIRDAADGDDHDDDSMSS